MQLVDRPERYGWAFGADRNSSSPQSFSSTSQHTPCFRSFAVRDDERSKLSCVMMSVQTLVSFLCTCAVYVSIHAFANMRRCGSLFQGRVRSSLSSCLLLHLGCFSRSFTLTYKPLVHSRHFRGGHVRLSPHQRLPGELVGQTGCRNINFWFTSEHTRNVTECRAQEDILRSRASAE